MLSVIYADCHIQALNVECHYADCHNAECRYDECRGPVIYEANATVACNFSLVGALALTTNTGVEGK
jgi:hypothetical protein